MTSKHTVTDLVCQQLSHLTPSDPMAGSCQATIQLKHSWLRALGLPCLPTRTALRHTFYWRCCVAVCSARLSRVHHLDSQRAGRALGSIVIASPCQSAHRWFCLIAVLLLVCHWVTDDILQTGPGISSGRVTWSAWVPATLPQDECP